MTKLTAAEDLAFLSPETIAADIDAMFREAGIDAADMEARIEAERVRYRATLAATAALTGDALASALRAAYLASGRNIHVEAKPGGWLYVRAASAAVGFNMRAPEARTTILQLNGDA